LAVVVPLCAFGFFHLFSASSARTMRALAWSALCGLATLLVGARPHLIVPALLPTVAAGGVMLEQLRSWPAVWLRRAVIAFMLLVGFAGLPLSMPVLPAEATSRYGGFFHHELGLSAPLVWEDGQAHELPQDFADMLGWESLVATVSLIYHSLPPELRSDCAVLAADRGQAGAVNLLGAQYGLPKAASLDGDYYHWGPGQRTGAVLIGVGMPAGVLTFHYDVVESAASVVTKFARWPTVHLLVCAQPHATLQEMWPLLAQAKGN
jgi:hypothetical protein